MKKFTFLSAFLLCTVVITYGQWTYTNLSGPRSFMGSATLGDKAYFAGGYNGTNHLSTVEVFDVTTGTCQLLLGGLSVPREIIGGGISCGSKIFFAGGYNLSSAFNTVDIYNTLTGQWTVEALSIARFSMASISYHDTVMFAGGFLLPGRSDVVDIYNIQTDQWSVSHLSIAREGIAAAVVGNLAIFAGGITNSGSTTRVDIYSFSDRSWSTASLSQARGMANATTVGNLVIIAGGVTSFNSPTNVVDIFDASTGIWSTATLSFPRSAQTNDATVSGKAFFAGGGIFMGSGYHTPSDVIDIYDPASNTWSDKRLPQPLMNHSVVEIGGYLIVAGGENASGNYVSRVEIYRDPTLIQVPDDYASIQEAINAGSNGDTVLVDEGTYYENINLFGRKPLMLASHYLTDGDTNHINNTIINGSQPVNPDMGSVVTFTNGEDTSSVLQGFTITGGTGDMAEGTEFRAGGGVLIQYSGAKLLDNHIEYNEVINDNWALGGGVCAGGPVTPLPWVVIRNNRINHNKAICTLNDNEGAGGGVQTFYNLIMTGNDISYNEVEGDWRGDGGGARLRGDFGHVDITVLNNTINHNKAKSVNAMTDLVLSGGLDIFWEVSGIVSNNTISYNVAEVPADKWCYGTGVLIEAVTSDDFIFEGNVIDSNTFTGGTCMGGGLCIYDTGGKFYNNVIRNNSGTYGGGLAIGDNLSDTATLFNNTITGNTGINGGGVYTENASGVLVNSIVWGNAATLGPSIFEQGQKLEVRYSDVQGLAPWTGEGNINAEPWLTEDGYHLSDSSELVDAGITGIAINGQWYNCPGFDIDGDVRPQSGAPEIGVDEVLFVSVPEPVGSQQLAVGIYPNPTTGKFQITNSKFQTNSKSQIQNIEVVDIYGKVIKEIVCDFEFAACLVLGACSLEFDITSCPAGIYFVRINLDDQVIVKKITKI